MDFEIKGVKYRADKLSVFEQLKVTRKLLPVMAGVMSDFQKLQTHVAAGDTASAVDIVLPKIAKTLSSLSDEDTNAIMFPCLSVVKRQHQNAWVPVCSGSESLAFDDIDLLALLSLVARVVADSLGNFLQELPINATPTPPAE